jgi:hypothetical protein
MILLRPQKQSRLIRSYCEHIVTTKAFGIDELDDNI